ncbi:Adhesion G protein-coupled receptor L3 [Geodia barretti]|nr:Adhesion G protein-coupled receptor L3 [Geodia barretti]
MLNDQLTGTMIGNATVYSVAIQDGFDINDNPSGDIPLVFTFFAENVEDDTTVTIPDPTDPVEPTVVPVVIPDVVAMFNVAEIERIIEEDVMLAAEDLGLNVTVEDFVRFDGCGSEETSLFDNLFSWDETAIGGIRTLACRCDAVDLRQTADRECGGNFTTGAVWFSPSDQDCDFASITRQLCMSPELEAIDNLQLNNLDYLGVVVVTELLEDLVNISSGNESESDVIFGVIEDVLSVSADQLVRGQLDFNTSGRLLYSLEILADAYPNPASIVQQITHDPFRFLRLPRAELTTNIITVTVTSDNRLQQGPDGTARARVDLLNMAGIDGLVVGVYNSPSLFVSRSQYIEDKNRTNVVLGSSVGVITVHFTGQLARTRLDEPVEIRFWKTAEASENGTATECAFWDQSLDEGFGAWSSEGCRLETETETRNFAECTCTHLTQFTLLVDLTPGPPTTVAPTVEREEEEDDSIEDVSYVGGLVCIVFLIIVIVTYLLSSVLRKSSMGASLINSSVCLSALFISYLVSYYVTEDDWACTIFSAIFHYSFLVTSISLLILALLKTLQPEKLGKIFLVLLLVQFIVPAVVVIISSAPDGDNYIDEEFCRPQNEPYWYGLLLVGGLIHMLAWLFLFAGLCVVHIRREKISTQWFEEWLGIALTLAVFELAWGFGLPSTNTLGLGASRLVFQIVFVVGCIALGIVELVFFVVLLREPREVWTGLVNRCIPGRSGGFDTSTYGISVEENPYVARGEGGSMEMSGVPPAKAGLRNDDEVSAAKRSPEASAMTEKLNGEDPEAIVNPAATEQDDEDGSPEMEIEVTEVKMDLGMYDDDADAAKDTRL